MSMPLAGGRWWACLPAHSELLQALRLCWHCPCSPTTAPALPALLAPSLPPWQEHACLWTKPTSAGDAALDPFHPLGASKRLVSRARGLRAGPRHAMRCGAVRFLALASQPPTPPLNVLPRPLPLRPPPPPPVSRRWAAPSATLRAQTSSCASCRQRRRGW